jgi:hypothetical protein
MGRIDTAGIPGKNQQSPESSTETSTPESAPTNPRAALLEDLFKHAAALAAAGDLATARAVHATIGQLLSGGDETGAVVVDLAERRDGTR